MYRYVLLAAVCLFPARGSTVFVSGSLATPESVSTKTFTLLATSQVVVQSYGFGGGTDLLGNNVAAGGFDPLIAVFSGSGASATIVTDTFGNPYASGDSIPGSGANCPPAGVVAIGTGSGNQVCGDPYLTIPSLGPGTYTLLISDSNYIPLAVNPGPPASTLLSDGFSDLTGGVFQTCNLPSGGLACITPNTNYAVDLTTQAAAGSVPEPESWWLMLTGVSIVGVWMRVSKKHYPRHSWRGFHGGKLK